MLNYAKTLAANPHTDFSHFGAYSTEMMHYAQESLLKSFSADKEEFMAIPTGSGSTGAIEKAMKIMHLQEEEKSVSVYITPYEHHSNLLPWIEFTEKVSELPGDTEGNLYYDKIHDTLVKDKADTLILSISAASNVTSILTDVERINSIVRSVRKERKIIWALDCAAFCCHHELNFETLEQLDFAYLSPHKNLGGAESCGVLIARKSIVASAKPSFPGGGTVMFVKGINKEDITYDFDVFNREIPGTPPFMGFYRAALCFELLKDGIGFEFIHQREKENTVYFFQRIE